MNQVAQLLRRPRIILEILYFIGDFNFSKHHWGLSFFMTRVIFFYLLAGGIIWDREGNFSKSIDWESHWDTSHRDTWTGCTTTYETQKC